MIMCLQWPDAKVVSPDSEHHVIIPCSFSKFCWSMFIIILPFFPPPIASHTSLPCVDLFPIFPPLFYNLQHNVASWLPSSFPKPCGFAFDIIRVEHVKCISLSFNTNADLFCWLLDIWVIVAVVSPSPGGCDTDYFPNPKTTTPTQSTSCLSLASSAVKCRDEIGLSKHAILSSFVLLSKLDVELSIARGVCGMCPIITSKWHTHSDRRLSYISTFVWGQ